MKSISSYRRHPLAIALLLAGSLGYASTGFAQATPPVSTDQPPASSTTKPMAPNKSETADSAFRKLDAGTKGYVAKDDTASLSGFDTAFQQADLNRDGRLSADEFKKAWSTYTGKSQ